MQAEGDRKFESSVAMAMGQILPIINILVLGVFQNQVIGD